MPRATAIQIYLKKGVPDDELILRIWRALQQKGRPQDVFRRMLRAGMLVMVENGEMPEAVVDEAGLDLVVERRRRARLQQDPVYGPHPVHGLPYPPYYVAAPHAPAATPPHSVRAPEAAAPAQPAAQQSAPAANPPARTAPDSQAESNQTATNGKKRIAGLM